MSGPVFFDTNVLVYADDTGSPAKQQLAIALVEEHIQNGTAVLSLQVLQEYFNAVTRKLLLDAEAAERKVQVFARTHVVCFQPHDIQQAIQLHRLFRISFWDALIVHAARLAGCQTLYSEDLQAGTMLGGVQIVNPFQTTRLRPSPTPRGRKTH
jgi:predicted nucleic acid-binding protein